MSTVSSFNPTVTSDVNGVRVVDPNPAGEIVPHEDMVIFLSLRANQKSKSILTEVDNGRFNNEVGTVGNSIELLTPQQKIETVAGGTLFGGKPNLTTDWTEIGGHSTELGKDLEGFGVTNVEIEIKSQVAPKVIIDFVDIRGATLFEQGSCSPYGLFFNLPYPIFELTVKGYYGRPVKYYLNLVKFNTKFNSETGNMECRGEFIGYSFAFLSDTIVGYVGASQYLKKETYNPQEKLRKKYVDTWNFYKENGLTVQDQAGAPWCDNPVLGVGRCFTINDLILKIKEFDTRSLPQIADSPEFNKLQNLLQLQLSYQAYRDSVEKLARNLVDNTSGLKATVVQSKAPGREQKLERFLLSQTSQTELLKPTGLISLALDKNSGQLPINIKTVKLLKLDNAGDYIGDLDVKGDKITMLTTADAKNLSGTDGSCPGCSNMFDALNDIPWHNILAPLQYTIKTDPTGLGLPNSGITGYIDLGYIFKNIDSEMTSLDEYITNYRREVTDQINSVIEASIGFKPTIRNIFTILLCNTDAFMEILLEVATNAEKYHDEIDYSGYSDKILHTEKGNGQPKLYAWPTYFKKSYTGKNDSKNQGTKEAFPGDEIAFTNWPEVRFVNDFIEAFLEYQRDIDIINDKTEGVPGFDNYVPINPLESPVWNNNPTKYSDLNLVNPNDIYTVIGERMFISMDHTYFSPIRTTPDAIDIPAIGLGEWNPIKNSDVTNADSIPKTTGSIDAWNLLNSKDGKSGGEVLSALINGTAEEFIKSVIVGLNGKYPNSLEGIDVTTGIVNGTRVALDPNQTIAPDSKITKIMPGTETGFKIGDKYITFAPPNGIELFSQSGTVIKPNPFDMDMGSLIKIVDAPGGKPLNVRPIEIKPDGGPFSTAIGSYTTAIERKTKSITFNTNGGDDILTGSIGGPTIDKDIETISFGDQRFFTTLAMSNAENGDLLAWWGTGSLDGLSQSNMALLSYWNYDGVNTNTGVSKINNNTQGISFFNPDPKPGDNNGTGIVNNPDAKLNNTVIIADDVEDKGISTPFITTPLWLDNVNSFRKSTTPLLTGPTFYIGDTSKNYTSDNIQDRNLAYLFLHTCKPTPLVIRYCTDDGYLFSLLNAVSQNPPMTSSSSIYSLKTFNTVGGIVKVPKIWALTLGAQLWRWKFFVGTNTTTGKRIWNRPLNSDGSSAGDQPTGFDPLAQPGFNSWDGQTRIDDPRNQINTYLNKVYGPAFAFNTTTQIQKSTFVSNYNSELTGFGNMGDILGTNEATFAYFNYYGAFIGNIGDVELTKSLNASTTPISKTSITNSYNWPQLWIAPHHIPYVHPEHFQDSSDGGGSVYVQLFNNSLGYLDYQTMMPVTRQGVSYTETEAAGVAKKIESLILGIGEGAIDHVRRGRRDDGNLGMIIQHLPDDVKDVFITEFEKWVDEEFHPVGGGHLATIDPPNFASSVLTNSYEFSQTISEQALGNGNDGNVALALKNDVGTLKSLLTDQYWILNSTPKIWYGIDSSDDTRSNPQNQFYNKFVISEDVFKDYLTSFHKTFQDSKPTKIDEINKKNVEETISPLSDDDIKLSFYRTFKSLTDKWISASANGSLFFNIIDTGGNCGRTDEKGIKNGSGPKPTLAAHFQYVNRVMGDIGDIAVLNLTKLLEIKDNIKISLYQYIGDLLMDNEYLFFPLPSYINFTAGGLSPEDLEDMFRPVLSADKVSCGPMFLSMYVGGNSRQLKYKGYANCPADQKALENFSDDSFLVSDHLSADNQYPSEISDPKSVSGSYTAFKVVYGLENQNHFKNIQLDQSEFSETAESLLAIDKLSQQGGTQQSTKGQNLNSVYLTRSYTCTVESFGNMMIQPMTYFDLIGVPMFNGAYLITEVKHNFKPNNASTTFKGVRQPRATIPIVTDAAVAMNMSFKDLKTTGTGKSLGVVKTAVVRGGVSGGGSVKSKNPDKQCGMASSNTVDTVYLKSLTRGGKMAPITILSGPPKIKINLDNQPITPFVRTIVTPQDFIKEVERLINQMVPTASKENKKRILTSTFAVGRTEQPGPEGGFKGFNNNLTGTESSGFSVFAESDVNGKVSAKEGGTGKIKYYYSFSNIGAGLTPLVSKIIERNMFATNDEPNEWAWRYFRDWNGYGVRTVDKYATDPNYDDCAIVANNESTYKKALEQVNKYTTYV